MYSSNPLGANAVIFNLLQCRITVTAVVKDLEDRQGNLHADLEGLGPSVVRKIQWTEGCIYPALSTPWLGTVSS